MCTGGECGASELAGDDSALLTSCTTGSTGHDCSRLIGSLSLFLFTSIVLRVILYAVAFVILLILWFFLQ